MARIELEEAANRPSAQSMTDDPLFRLQEGQFVSHIELIRVTVVFRAATIRKPRQRIRDVIVRRTLTANGGAPRK